MRLAQLVSIALLASLPVLPADNPAALYERGVRLARGGQPQEALATFRELEKLDPADPKVLNMIGVTLAAMGRLEEADRAYARALAHTPGFVAARKNRAVNSFARGDYPTAAREFERLRAFNPDDFVPHLFLGLLAIEDARLEIARAHLLNARKHAPDNAKAGLALVKVEFLLGQRSQALELARQLRRNFALTDAERFELGVLLGQFGVNDEAVELLDELRRRNPNAYELGFNIALLEYRRGHLDSALATVEELMAAGQRSGELFNLRGWIYNRMHRPDRARESLQQAIALDSRNGEHYLDLSTLFMNQADHESALRVLIQGMEQNDRDARLPMQAGIVLRSLRRMEEAGNWYRTALRIDPFSGPAHLALADLLFENGRREEAFAQLENSVKLLPSYALVHYAYGALLLESAGESEMHLLDKAERMLHRAVTLDPSFANSYYLLGKSSLKKDDDSAAQVFFEKALAVNPKQVNAAYQLSRIAARRGDRVKAAAMAQIVRSARAGALHEDEQRFTALVQQSLRTNTNTAFDASHQE